MSTYSKPLRLGILFFLLSLQTPHSLYFQGNKSNQELVQNLKEERVIKSPKVEQVMLQVDRKHFVKDESQAYQDNPLYIGYGATISAPHMHAYALEVLSDFLQPNQTALDVGSGSGYLTVCMSYMGAGKVYGVEHIQELVDFSLKNVEDHYGHLLLKERIEIVKGDGRQGLKKGAPYKAIHVGAASAEYPEHLINQLANGGRLLIPEGRNDQKMVIYDKDENGRISRKETLGVRYVPLTDEKTQKHEI